MPTQGRKRKYTYHYHNPWIARGWTRQIDRFEDFISPEPNSGCWLWTKNVSGYGYAMIVADNKTYYVHRMMYEQHVGPIPNGNQIDHICRVKCCVNPRHLRSLTPAENVKAGGGLDKAHAMQRAMTHCKRGHLFSSENTYVYRGSRFCRACHKDKENIRRAKCHRQLQNA